MNYIHYLSLLIYYLLSCNFIYELLVPRGAAMLRRDDGHELFDSRLDLVIYDDIVIVARDLYLADRRAKPFLYRLLILCATPSDAALQLI